MTQPQRGPGDRTIAPCARARSIAFVARTRIHIAVQRRRMKAPVRHRSTCRAPRSSGALLGSSPHRLVQIGATPRNGNFPVAGCFLFSEVTCPVVGTFTVSPFPANHASGGASDRFRAGRTSGRSSMPQCATAAAAVSTAQPYSNSTSPRSTTSTRSRMAALTHRATSFSPAHGATGSRATCCRLNSSYASRGPARTSLPTRGRSIERSSAARAAR